MKAGRRLTRRRMCPLGQVSRAGFYRQRQAPGPVDRDMELRDALQHLALEMPSYGWRRITAELRRRSWRVNHKRVRRLMREDNLLCLRRRRFVLTTDSDHGFGVYPNLARQLVLTQLDQLWVADLTYIRLEVEFVYEPATAGDDRSSRSASGGRASSCTESTRRRRPGRASRFAG